MCAGQNRGTFSIIPPATESPAVDLRSVRRPEQSRSTMLTRHRTHRIVFWIGLATATACRSEGQTSLGALPDEIANARLVVVQGPFLTDSADRGLTHPECPMRLRDTRSRWEFVLSEEHVRPSDSNKDPASWPHEGDYMIVLPGSTAGPGSARVRIACETLRPMGMLKVGA